MNVSIHQYLSFISMLTLVWSTNILAQESNNALISINERRAGIFYIGELISRYDAFLKEQSPSVYVSNDGTMTLKTDCRNRISEIEVRGSEFFTERFVRVGDSDLLSVLRAYGEPGQITEGDPFVLEYEGVSFQFGLNGRLPSSDALLKSPLSGITVLALNTEATIEPTGNLTGTWNGVGEQGIDTSRAIQMTINQNWNTQSTCETVGRIAYPNLGCGGNIIKGEGVFYEQLTYGTDRCVARGLIQLMNDPNNGGLRWEWYYPGGQSGANASLLPPKEWPPTRALAGKSVRIMFAPSRLADANDLHFYMVANRAVPELIQDSEPRYGDTIFFRYYTNEIVSIVDELRENVPVLHSFSPRSLGRWKPAVPDLVIWLDR